MYQLKKLMVRSQMDSFGLTNTESKLRYHSNGVFNVYTKSKNGLLIVVSANEATIGETV